MAAFIVGLQQQLVAARPLVSPGIFDNIVACATDTAAVLIERAAMQCRFNRVSNQYQLILIQYQLIFIK